MSGQIPPRKMAHLVGVRVRVKVRVRVWGQFSSGAIVLEPYNFNPLKIPGGDKSSYIHKQSLFKLA